MQENGKMHSPSSLPKNPTTRFFFPLFNSFICHFSSQHHRALRGNSLEKNHCSCYSELKSSFPQNLLEPSWHFFFSPPTTKTARGGWSVCIWCRGGKAKPHKASPALLLHTQSTEKTIHVQRRGMNKFLNEEIARKKKKVRGKEIRSAHTLPKAPNSTLRGEMGSERWKEWERKHGETCAV